MPPKKRNPAGGLGRKKTKPPGPNQKPPHWSNKKAAPKNTSASLSTSGVKTRAMRRKEQNEGVGRQEQNLETTGQVKTNVEDKRSEVKTRAMRKNEQDKGLERPEQHLETTDQVNNRVRDKQSEVDSLQSSNLSHDYFRGTLSEAGSERSGSPSNTAEAIAVTNRLESRLAHVQTKLYAARTDWQQLREFLRLRLWPKNHWKLAGFGAGGARQWQVRGSYFALKEAIRKLESLLESLEDQLRRRLVQVRNVAAEAYNVSLGSPAVSMEDDDDDDDDDAASQSSKTREVLECLRNGTLDQFLSTEDPEGSNEAQPESDAIKEARERFLVARRGLIKAEEDLRRFFYPFAYPKHVRDHEARVACGESLPRLDLWVLGAGRDYSKVVERAQAEYSDAASEARKLNAVNLTVLSSRFGSGLGTSISTPLGFGGAGMPSTHKDHIPRWALGVHGSSGDIESAAWSEAASSEAITASLATNHSIPLVFGDLAHWRHKRHLQKWGQLGKGGGMRWSLSGTRGSPKSRGHRRHVLTDYMLVEEGGRSYRSRDWQGQTVQHASRRIHVAAEGLSDGVP